MAYLQTIESEKKKLRAQVRERKWVDARRFGKHLFSERKKARGKQ